MSTFWYPQLARALPRSGRIPRSHYNITSDQATFQPGSIERVSFSDYPVEPLPGFFQTYGVHTIIAILLFGGSLFLTVACWDSRHFWGSQNIFPELVFIMGLAVALSAVPLGLYFKHRAMLRKLEVTEQETPSSSMESNTDRFLY